MLTRKQHELLIFIHERMQDTGIPPSFDEMKDALQLASKSGIHRLITALEERGFIRRLPNRARAMEVVRLPDSFTASSHKKNEKPILAKSPSIKTIDTHHIEQEASNINVPLMGRIAAGVPISAIQQQTNTLSLPPDMIGNGEHFALEVKGDSMVDLGILNGDTVIIRKSDTALPGEIVVALVDEEEATLKRYKRQGNTIALEAANPLYETKVFDANRIRIQGKLAGLIRRY